MEISELAWRLVILFTPGIICSLLYDYLVIHPKWTNVDLLIRSFLFGLISYLFLQIFLLIVFFAINIIVTKDYFYLSFWKSLTDKSVVVDFSEILYSSITAVLLGFIISKIVNDKKIIRFAQKRGFTKKIGDDSVWSFFLNSDEVQWVWIRFPEKDLLYEGWVQSFSESESIREIVLQDVRVYTNSNTKNLLYSISGVYLSGKPDGFIVELPNSNSNIEK